MVQFTALPYSRPKRADRDLSGAEVCFLLRDNWDDYSYKTTVSLVYFDSEGERHDIGNVKIMGADMESGYTELDEVFTELPAGFASLGEDQDYYENLIGLTEEVRVAILTALRDVIWDQETFEEVQSQRPFLTSLTRSVSPREIAKFRVIVHEQATLTPFHFQYAFPGESEAVVEIQVEPDSIPPSNIHVIIGRNGVGKTSLLRAISDLLRNGRGLRKGRITFIGDEDEEGSTFSNLVAVAFSAFDEFDPPPNAGTTTGIKYTYIGLRKRVRLKSGEYESRNKTAADLRKDFVGSTLTCSPATPTALAWSDARAGRGPAVRLAATS